MRISDWSSDVCSSDLRMRPHVMDPQLLKRIVEAALLASGQPMTVAQLIALFPDEQPICSDEIGQALHALSDDCAERSIELVEVASGFRLQVRREIHPWITRLWTERPTRRSEEHTSEL